MMTVSQAVCVVVAVLGLVTFGQAAWNNAVCTQVTQDTGGGPTKPTLPQSYTTRVEMNHLNASYTLNAVMQFDHANNMAAIKMQKFGTWINMIYNFQTDELFTIYQDTNIYNNCTIEAISTSRIRFLFGWTAATSGGGGTTNTPEDVFRFGGTHKAQYIGKTTIRGFPVNAWQSCELIPLGNGDATAKTTWYFLDTTAWSSAFSVTGTVPVRLSVVGVQSDQLEFAHNYEFSEWQTPLTDPQMFRTPAGTVCNNRKATAAVPQLPTYFKFEAEVVSTTDNTQMNVKEWYDSEANLFRYDTYIGVIVPGENGYQSKIDDFNVGVSYVINRVQGTCIVQNITRDNSFDVSKDDPKTIKLKNPYQFMNLNRSTYRYAGKRQMRGITMDVWSMMQNEPSLPGLGYTHEWYFAQDNGYKEYTTNDIIKTDPKVYSFTAYTAGAVASQVVWNIHNFELGRPEVWDFDFSICFASKQQRHFQFQVTADYRKVVMQSEKGFKTAVMNAIAASAGISAIRVSQIQVDYLPSSIFVTFTLLDQQPKGSVQNTPQVALSDAVNTIQTKMQNGAITIKVPKVGTKGENFVLTPVTASYKELMSRNHLYYYLQSQSDDGYGPGAMAGIGVAMIVLGLVTGVGVMYFVYKRGGGAFPSGFGVQRFAGSEGGDDMTTLPKE